MRKQNDFAASYSNTKTAVTLDLTIDYKKNLLFT